MNLEIINQQMASFIRYIRADSGIFNAVRAAMMIKLGEMIIKIAGSGGSRFQQIILERSGYFVSLNGVIYFVKTMIQSNGISWPHLGVIVAHCYWPAAKYAWKEFVNKGRQSPDDVVVIDDNDDDNDDSDDDNDDDHHAYDDSVDYGSGVSSDDELGGDSGIAGPSGSEETAFVPLTQDELDIISSLTGDKSTNTSSD